METDLLASFIGQKLGVLEQMRQISRRQIGLIDEGDMTGLMTVLAAKQTLITDLQSLERKLDPFREQDPDRRIWRSTADRERCREESERAAALLAEVMLIEKQCETALKQRRDDVAHRLQGAHQAAHARTAYLEIPQSTAGGFDLTSER